MDNKNNLHISCDYRNIPINNINPSDQVKFCDLRGSDFSKADLSGVEFLGCRLNGVSFKDANLTNAEFIGCFVADNYEPIDIEGSIFQNTEFIDCHISNLHKINNLLPECLWESKLADTA